MAEASAGTGQHLRWQNARVEALDALTPTIRRITLRPFAINDRQLVAIAGASFAHHFLPQTPFPGKTQTLRRPP